MQNETRSLYVDGALDSVLDFTELSVPVCWRYSSIVQFTMAAPVLCMDSLRYLTCSTARVSCHEAYRFDSYGR